MIWSFCSAFKVFYTALENISSKVEEEEALVVFEKALENVMPHVEVRSKRIGGATFQIPHPVREDRRVSLGMKWMIAAARNRNEKTRGNRQLKSRGRGRLCKCGGVGLVGVGG